MKKVILKTVEAVFFVFSIVVLCLRLYELAVQTPGDFSDGIVFRLCACVAFFVFAVVVILICMRFRQKLSGLLSKIPAWKLALCLFLFTVAVRITVAYFIPLDMFMHVDVNTYRRMIEDIISTGSVTRDVSYAVTYPYTLNFAFFMYPVFKLFGTNVFAISSFLSVLSSVSLTLFFVTLKEYAGKNISFCGLLIFSLLPSEIFFPQYMYHEHTLVLAGAIVFFLVFYCAHRAERLAVKALCFSLSIVVLVVEFRINMLALILIIALFIYYIYMIFASPPTVKQAIVSVVALTATLVMAFSLSGILLPMLRSQVLPENAQGEKLISAGVKNYYIGFNYERGGLWGVADNDAYYKYSMPELSGGVEKTEDEIKEYQVNLLKERLSEYAENPLKIFGLFAKKMNFMWAKDHSIPVAFIKDDATRELILKYYVYYIELFILSMFNIITAVINLFSYPRKKVEGENPSLYLQMLLIGTTCALLLNEVMPKYTLPCVLPFASLAILQYRNASDNITGLKSRISRKKVIK